MADLLMLCPSRGRPQNVAALWEAWQATSEGVAELLIITDPDDPERANYRIPPSFRCWTVPERLRLGGTLNLASQFFAGNHFAIGFLGDDHRPRSQGWDVRLVEALRELGTGVVYGNDLFQGERLPTAVAMTSDIVRTLGYFVPPGLIHLYMDDYWKSLGEAIGRLRYLPEVIIEHVHPIAHKAEWDERYHEVNHPEMYARDRLVFSKWIKEDSAAAVRRLQEVAAQPAQ